MRDGLVRVAAVGLAGMLCLGAGAQSSASKGALPVGSGSALGSQLVSPLAIKIAAILADPAMARAHWGVMVETIDGRPIYSLNEAQLFQPASNAKLFTTAAAMALLGGDRTFVTRVFAKGKLLAGGNLAGDVVLVGGGDANLSAREIPYVAPSQRRNRNTQRGPGAPPVPEVDPLRFLAQMADQVAATGLKVVTGDVVGDDTLFPWEPYPQDWSIDDTVWGYGAPVSALTVTDNQLQLVVTPGARVGGPASWVITPVTPYYTIDAAGLTTGAPKSGNHVQFERALGSKALRLYGTIAVDAPPDKEEIAKEEIAIHDPAEFAAIALKQMLEARGITIQGVARAQHRLPVTARGFLDQANEPIAPIARLEMLAQQARASTGPNGCGPCDGLPTKAPDLLAMHRSIPLREDVMVTLKVSQNLHAELLLRHLGQSLGQDGTEHETENGTEHRTEHGAEHQMENGTAAQGARVVRSFLTAQVGIDQDDFVFFDGSGLSGHDLVTPRATARLLQFAQAQPWFADWRRSLPVGGQDGSLISRFGEAPLKDHVFAKTGTLGEVRALSGYVECASGRTVIFSIMVGNHAPGTNADRTAMDGIVKAIAAAN